MTISMKRIALIGYFCITYADGFAPSQLSFTCGRSFTSPLFSEATATSTDTPTKASTQIDPKEAVKLFGRLAEKYIMLDASAGMCCYSGCSDCEFREPGGGYRMSDQSSSRPKWIPVYDHRQFQSGKEHRTKWSTEIFVNGPGKYALSSHWISENFYLFIVLAVKSSDPLLFNITYILFPQRVTAVSKEEFVLQLINMQYSPPLGGPYLASSAATIEDDTAASALFDLLAGEKEKLTKHRMGKQMKVLANGEEGLIWTHFSAALGLI